MKRLLAIVGALALSASAFGQDESILERGAGRNTFIYSIAPTDCFSNLTELMKGLYVLFSQHGIRLIIQPSDPTVVTQQLTLQVEVGCTRLDNDQIDFAHADFNWAWKHPTEDRPDYRDVFDFGSYYPREMGRVRAEAELVRAILALFDLALHSYVQAYANQQSASDSD